MNKSELLAIKELRRKLTMDAAAFSTAGAVVIDGQSVLTYFGDNYVDGQRVPTTDFVRDITKRWRETWILPVLDRLIEKYEKKHQKVRVRR